MKKLNNGLRFWGEMMLVFALTLTFFIPLFFLSRKSKQLTDDEKEEWLRQASESGRLAATKGYTVRW
jgi:hypothetical protein